MQFVFKRSICKGLRFSGRSVDRTPPAYPTLGIHAADYKRTNCISMPPSCSLCLHRASQRPLAERSPTAAGGGCLFQLHTRDGLRYMSCDIDMKASMWAST